MNTKIALSGISILASLALVGGATFAFFTDAGSSTSNVFATGSLDMAVSDNNQTDLDNVNATWGLANAGPGDTFTGDLNIRNLGSVNANHVELKFTNVVTPAGSGPGTTEIIPMDSVIEITTLGWDTDGNGSTDVDLLPLITNTNANGIIDLDDLENQTADDIDNLMFAGTQSNNHLLLIAGRLHPTQTIGEHMGDSVTMSLDVTMNQDASQ